MPEPTGMLPAPPDDEDTRAILEDFKGLMRTTTGVEYAKALLVPSVPGKNTLFQNVTTEAAWRTYWLGRKGVGGVVDAEVHTPVTAEGKVAAITHNIRQLCLDVAEHGGESTGNLDVLKRRIEDQVRALVGLAPLQPELGITDGWLGSWAERAAIATLRRLGFTYHGGSQWKPPLSGAFEGQRINGLISRMKGKPGRYCVTSTRLLAMGALYFVDVDVGGKVHQLTPQGERDGELRDDGWRGDELVLDPRLIEEFPGGAPVFGGDQRAHVICLCPDCAKPRPRPALRQTRTYVELGLSQPAYDEIHAKLRAADYGHAFMPDGAIDLHGLAAVLDPDAEPRASVAIDTATEWERLHKPAGYQALGEVCELWGKAAKAMTQRELLAFVGFLDELATRRAVDARRALQLADRQMLVALRSYGAGSGDVLRPPAGAYGQDEFHEAAEWLLQRGHIERDQDQAGPFVRILHRPAVKCDGNHGGPACGDPECWNEDGPGRPGT